MPKALPRTWIMLENPFKQTKKSNCDAVNIQKETSVFYKNDIPHFAFGHHVES